MSEKAMACRCEDVTLDEIERAIAEGHDDLESLKRYTGFGTGWCQGRQCVTVCARALAAKTGAVPTVPITPRPPAQPAHLGALATLATLSPEEG